MKNRIIWMLSIMCLLVLPVRIHAGTENSISYITRGEIGKVSSSRLVIKNTHGDLQPGDYFTINLIGAEFEMDDSGEPKIFSSSAEFDKRTKTSVTGRLLDNVAGRAEVGISFSSKILENEAKVEIDGDDSYITSGTYIYATTSDSDISYKGELTIGKERAFYDFINLEPIMIKERYNSAFQSLVTQEYKTPGLIQIEVPKGLYEFENAHYLEPITFIVEDDNENETRYELGEDSEVVLNTAGNILTFREYNEQVFDYISGTYTIRLENIRLKATKEGHKQDVYMNISGRLVEEQSILVANQVTEKLVLETSIEGMEPGKDQRIRFSLQEGKANTLLTTSELSFGLTNGVEIDFKDDFKLKLVDGPEVYHEEQSRFKIEKEGHAFTITGFSRDKRNNLIHIEGELTVQIPSEDEIEDDIKFFVSDMAVPGVLYSTVLEAEEKLQKPRVGFKVGQAAYEIDGGSYPMDAKVYVSKHNRIMVPVRYLSHALGVEEKDVKWDGPTGMITIKTEDDIKIDTKKKQVERNSNITTLSDIELIEGRIFVPVGEIGKALDVEVYWDGINRTATFN